jgi:hypothetical protein
LGDFKNVPARLERAGCMAMPASRASAPGNAASLSGGQERPDPSKVDSVDLEKIDG